MWMRAHRAVSRYKRKKLARVTGANFVENGWKTFDDSGSWRRTNGQTSETNVYISTGKHRCTNETVQTAREWGGSSNRTERETKRGSKRDERCPDRDRDVTNARQQRGAGSLRTDIDRSSRSHPPPKVPRCFPSDSPRHVEQDERYRVSVPRDSSHAGPPCL